MARVNPTETGRFPDDTFSPYPYAVPTDGQQEAIHDPESHTELSQ